MTIRQFIKKLFVTIIMIGIVLAAVLKVGYILICKVIVMIIFAVLAIRYWVGEDIRKAEEEKRGTWLFTLGFIGLTVLTMLAANIPGQVQRDQYLYLTKEHTEQLEKVLLREATADSERCIQWYEKQQMPAHVCWKKVTGTWRSVDVRCASVGCMNMHLLWMEITVQRI